jgi:hypothetical protein
MATDWKNLTTLTQGQDFTVERVRLAGTNIAIEGQFDLPALAKLTFEDQVFVAAFIRCHGSIREMEKYFGVSYPTIKSRLNRIGEQLEFVRIEPAGDKDSILSQLERGEISTKDAIEQLRNRQEKNT